MNTDRTDPADQADQTDQADQSAQAVILAIVKAAPYKLTREEVTSLAYLVWDSPGVCTCMTEAEIRRRAGDACRAVDSVVAGCGLTETEADALATLVGLGSDHAACMA